MMPTCFFILDTLEPAIPPVLVGTGNDNGNGNGKVTVTETVKKSMSRPWEGVVAHLDLCLGFRVQDSILDILLVIDPNHRALLHSG